MSLHLLLLLLISVAEEIQQAMEVQDTWPSVRRKEIESVGVKDLNFYRPTLFSTRHVLENPSPPLDRAP